VLLCKMACACDWGIALFPRLSQAQQQRVQVPFDMFRGMLMPACGLLDLAAVAGAGEQLWRVERGGAKAPQCGGLCAPAAGPQAAGVHLLSPQPRL
jgi:hypothetical protein